MVIRQRRRFEDRKKREALELAGTSLMPGMEMGTKYLPHRKRIPEWFRR